MSRFRNAGQAPGGQACNRIAIDLAELARKSAEASEAAATLARLTAAAAAADEAFVAVGLSAWITIAVPPQLMRYLPPPPKPPRPKRCVSGAAKADAEEAARSWWIAREANHPAGATPPSQNDDEQAAALALPDVSRRIIRSLRPLAWRQKPNRKPAAPKNGASR